MIDSLTDNIFAAINFDIYIYISKLINILNRASEDSCSSRTKIIVKRVIHKEWPWLVITFDNNLSQPILFISDSAKGNPSNGPNDPLVCENEHPWGFAKLLFIGLASQDQSFSIKELKDVWPFET